MRLTFQHTLGDIIELNCSLRTQRIRAWLVILMGMASLGMGLWVFLCRDSQPNPIPVFVAGTAFILLGAIAPRLAGLGAWFLKAQRAPYELEFSSAGVVFVRGSEEVSASWNRFSRWYETKKLLALVAPSEVLAVPRRSCGEAEWQELLSLVRSKLGDPARW
jgi:hypothetical protein